MSDDQLQLIGSDVITWRRIRSGRPVYLQGDALTNLYAVHSGSFKSLATLHDGRDQITQFSTSGELMGLDGMGHRVHPSTALALEDSEVCSIPFDALHRVVSANEQWRDSLCRIMGAEILREQAHMLVLGSGSTDGRVAVFLLQLSARMRSRGYSATEFNLRMSRAEIGSYLGLRLETVSRTLSSFQKQGLLLVKRRHVRIRNMMELQRVAESGGT